MLKVKNTHLSSAVMANIGKTTALDISWTNHPQKLAVNNRMMHTQNRDVKAASYKQLIITAANQTK